MDRLQAGILCALRVPVVLERFTGEDRAANIPEFVPIAPDAIAKVQEQFLDAYSFLRAGMANERTSNYPGAVRLYQRGLEIEPDNVELLNAMGFALFQQGKSREAVAELEKAVAIDPKHVKAHNNRALAAIDAGELELAEAHYREPLAIKPDAANYNVGASLAQQALAQALVSGARAGEAPAEPPARQLSVNDRARSAGDPARGEIRCRYS